MSLLVPTKQLNNERQELIRENQNLINHSSQATAIALAKKAPANNSVPLRSNKATQLQRQELIRENQNLINHSSQATAIAPPKKAPANNNVPLSSNRREWDNGLSSQPKPKPTPTALNTRRYGSADAAERWNAGSAKGNTSQGWRWKTDKGEFDLGYHQLY